MTELDDADLLLAGAPPRGDVVLLSVGADEELAIESALRERGFAVVTSPLTLLESRTRIESPRVILLDIDQPGALDAVDPTRDLGRRIGATLLCIGDPRRAGGLESLGSVGRLFPRPVEIDLLVDYVAGYAEPSRRSPRRRSANTPDPTSLRDTVPPPTRDSESPGPSDYPSNADPFDIASILPFDDDAPGAALPPAQLSPELEQLMISAERRVAGSQIHAPSTPPPEDDNLTLAPELLLSLDEPLELDEEEARTGSEPGAGEPGQRGAGKPPASQQGPRSRRSPSEEPEVDREPPTPVEGSAQRRNFGLALDFGPASVKPFTTHARAIEPTPATGLPLSQKLASQAALIKQMAATAPVDTTAAHGSSLQPSVRQGLPPPPIRPAPAPERSTPTTAQKTKTEVGRPVLTSTREDARTPLPAAGAPTGPQRRPTPAAMSSPVNPRPAPPKAAASNDPVRAAPTYAPAAAPPDPPPPRHAPKAPAPEQPPGPARPIPVTLGEGEAAVAIAGAVAGRATGSLALTGGDGVRRVVLQDGDIVTAASWIEAETLLAFLTSRGDIERDLVPRFEGKLPPFGRHAGAALIAHGHLGQDDLWPVLRAHAEWIIGRALLLPSCTCELEPEPPGRLKTEPNVFGGATGAEVLVESVRRAVAPEAALKRLGGPRARIDDGPRASLLGECALRREDEDLLRSARGRTVGELTRGAEPELINVLYALACLGVVEVLQSAGLDREEAPREADPLDEEAVRQRVRARVALVEDGDYFSLLGVSHAATSYEIRRAYLELRRAFEPSRLLTAATADLYDDVRLVIEVLDEAFEILRDPHRRERYRKAISSPSPP